MNKLKIINLKITGGAFMGNITKPDRRFRSGYRVIGQEPKVSYTIDMMVEQPAPNYFRMADTVVTLIDTVRVVGVDSIRNQVTMKGVRINTSSSINFNIDFETRFSSVYKVYGEGSPNPRI